MPTMEGKLTMRPSTSENILIDQPCRPSDAKAMRSLSGETRGEREMVPRWVTWCCALPVVVHLPDFFVSTPSCDVVDVGLGDAGNSAAQAGDDLIGKAVSDQSRIILAGSLVVLLAQDLR